MTFDPINKTAWFSSSATKSAIKVWVQLGGIVESNALKADFVFAKDNKANDVQRLFRSEEFCGGHMTVFSTNVICDIVTETFNHFDVGNYIILPHKKFESVCCRGQKFSSDTEPSEEDVGKKVDTLTNNRDDASSSSESVRRGISTSEDGTIGNSCTQRILYPNLNLDVVHLDDIRVPPVRLMDFKPGVDGCKVVKRRTGIFQKHNR